MRRADVLAALLALACAAAPLRAQEESRSTEVDRITVVASTALPASGRSGWVPVRVRVENQREKSVAIQVSVEHGYSDVLAASAAAQLEPGATREFSLLAPVQPWQGDPIGTLEVLTFADGARLGPSLRLRSEASADSNERLHGVLVCGPQARAAAAQVHDSPLPVPDPSNPQLLVRPWVRTIEAADLPTDWRAYSTLSMLVLEPEAAPSPAACAAIEAWVRLGGLLIVRGAAEQAQAWLERHDLAPRPHSRLNTLGAPLAPRPAWHRHGFGRIGTARDADGLSMAEVVAELPHLSMPIAQLEPDRELSDGPFGPRTAALHTGIPGVHDVPRARLTLLLLAFACVAGPVQIWRLRRRPDRTWSMLIWTPVISLIFCALVIATGMLAQGLGRKQALASITWLATGDRAATALYVRELFVGNGFGMAPRLDAGSLLLPDSLDQLPEVSERYAYWPEESGRLEGAWTPSRAPILLRGAWSGAWRAEVAVRRDGDAVVATSGFDFPLHELHWRAADGHLWRAAETLLPGATLRLVPAEEEGWAPTCLASWEDDFGYDGGGRWLTHRDAIRLEDRIAVSPPQIPVDLPAGCWRARADAAPWLPDCGISARDVIGEHWIFGEAEEQP